VDLREYAHHESEELEDYMEGVIPDKLLDLSARTGEMDIRKLLRSVRNVATYLPEYELDDEFSFLVDAMLAYMSRYDF
jgi:hypothetical protein